MVAGANQKKAAAEAAKTEETKQADPTPHEWSITIHGRTTVHEEYRKTQEEGVVAKARAFVADIDANVGTEIILASVTTNTTGEVDVTKS